MNFIPVELQEALKRGECILFVGAGFSKGLPTWKELMEPLAEELGIDPNEDPLYIAEYYENEFGRFLFSIDDQSITRIQINYL